MELLTSYVELLLENARNVSEFLSNFGIDVLTYANKYLSILMHSAQALIRFVSKVPAALGTTLEYVVALPLYIQTPIILLVSLSVIYLILGR